MSKQRKILIMAFIMILSSQIYIEILLTNFRISFAAIMFTVFLYLFKELRVYSIGIFAGLILYIHRLILYLIDYGQFFDKLTSYLPEIVFYTFWGFTLVYVLKRNREIKLHTLFVSMIIIDLSSNLLEISLSSGLIFEFSLSKMISILLLVATTRSFISIAIIILIKYYRMFLIKEEHEKRYKRLVWLVSKLKTEMYWMEKNMKYIERVMEQSYNLFENIKNNEDRDSWEKKSLEISKDVHEIKKEYALALVGLEEVLEGNIKEDGLNFNEILSILKDSLNKLINSLDKNIELDFNTYEDFYTNRHYELISILRNILVNSIEAIDKNKGKITLIHMKNNKSHTFVIQDNGKGIKKEDIPNVFEPGFTTKVNSDTGYIGRGVGLNLVQKLVEDKFNGKIKLYSLFSEETSISVSIPIDELEED